MITKFKAEVTKQLTSAFKKYDIERFTPAQITITCNLRGKCAGRAGHKSGKYYLKFSTEAITNHWDEMVKDTIPHEIAHIICYMRPSLGKKHNRGWKRVCKSLGGDDSRCHTMALTPAKKVKEYQYRTDSGELCTLKSVRHNRLQRGQVDYYKFTATGDRVTKSHYVRKKHIPLTKATHNKRVPAKSNLGSGSSKKDRAQVIYNSNLTLSRPDMIKLFISQVGLTAAGASTYYYNCKR